MQLDQSNLIRAWIRTNTKEGLDQTGIVAAVILCFDTKPESRIALWYTKVAGKPPEWNTLFQNMPTEAGELKPVNCLSGGLGNELKILATEAHTTLKKSVKPEYGRLYKIENGKAELVKARK